METSNNNPFVIFGSGAHAREVADIIRHGRQIAGGPPLLGFLDEVETRHGIEIDDTPVLGGFSWLKTRADTVQVVVAIGDNATRWRIAEALSELGAVFGSAVSPLAHLSPRSEIGSGAMIFPFVFVSSNVKIGRHVILGVHSSVSHDCRLGEAVFLCPGARTTGAVTIGDQVMLGTNSCVIPGRSVGAQSTVGAGGCVVRDVPSGVTAVGVPAQAWA